jgi:hypothetical protein
MEPTCEEQSSIMPVSKEPKSLTSSQLTRGLCEAQPRPTASSTRAGSRTKKAVGRTRRTNKHRPGVPTLEGPIIQLEGIIRILCMSDYEPPILYI